ncbi:MAG: discoidin domain-containing protein [Acidobacteriota bacterium]
MGGANRGPQHLLALGIFAAATIAAYPAIVRHPATTLPDATPDTLLNAWILWRSSVAMPLSQAWWNAPAFAPLHGTMAFSETLLGLAPFSVPVQWLTGSPAAAYDAAFLLASLLSAAGAYALGYALTKSPPAALVGGMAFGFCTYRLDHVAHIQVLAAWGLPLGLAALHRFQEDRRARWLVFFGGSFLWQGLCNGYYLFFSLVMIGGWIAWFSRSLRDATRAGIATVLPLAALAPILARYAAIHSALGLGRAASEIALYGTDIAGIFHGHGLAALWTRANSAGESRWFPGFVLALLALAALLAGRRSPPRSPLVFYAVMAVTCYVLALGPEPRFRGRPLGPIGPYGLLMHLPGFSSLRAPARFVMLATLCLAMLAAFAIASARRPRAAAAIAAIALYAEGRPTAPAAPAPDPRPIAAMRPAVTLELPMGTMNLDAAAMYRSIFHGGPVVNGYSGHQPPHYPALVEGLARLDPAVIAVLRQAGLANLVVAPAPHGKRDRKAAVLRAVPDARLAGASAGFQLFELPPVPRDPRPVLGPPVPIARLEASPATELPLATDGRLDTTWMGPQADGTELLIDLGAPVEVAAVVLYQGAFASLFPLDASVDAELAGEATEVWHGSTIAATVEGALTDPRAVPVVASFAPRRADRIRITLHETRKDAVWAVAEVEVRTPASTASAAPRRP